MNGLPVNLPNPTHSHYDTVLDEFVTHTHPNAGTHRHRTVGGRSTIEYTPGNYSPVASR